MRALLLALGMFLASCTAAPAEEALPGALLEYGPGPRSLRVGTVLPTQGPGAPVGAVISRVLARHLAEANARGGIRGRSIELLLISYDSNKSDGVAEADQALERGGLALLLASYSPGAIDRLRRTAEQRGVAWESPVLRAEGAAEGAAGAVERLLERLAREGRQRTGNEQIGREGR